MAAPPRRGGSGSESHPGQAPGPGNIYAILIFLEGVDFPHLFSHHVKSVSGDGGERGDVILDGLVLLDLWTEKELCSTEGTVEYIAVRSKE